MNKKWLIAISVVIVLIGGISIMTTMKTPFDLFLKKDFTKLTIEEQNISVERQSVKALKNTFSDIAEVKVKKSVYDKKTGTYAMYVAITNNEKKTLDFMYNYEKQGTYVYGFVYKNTNIQKKGVTKNEIKVTFSNGTGGII